MDALTKVMVGLFEEPERPRNALEYIRKHLGASQQSQQHGGNGSTGTADTEALRRENESLRAQLQKANQQLDEMRKRGGGVGVGGFGNKDGKGTKIGL